MPRPLDLPGFTSVAVPGWNVVTVSSAPEPERKSTPPEQPPAKPRVSTRRPGSSSVLSSPFFMAKRHYSVHAWHHTTSPFRISDILEDDNFKLPSDLQFTLANPQYITRCLREVRAIYRAIGGKNPEQQNRAAKDLVVFKPERMGLQYLGAMVATEIKTEDDADYLNTCKKLYKLIQPNIAQNHKLFLELAEENEALVHDLAHRHQRTEFSDDPRAQHYLGVRNIIMQRLASKGYDAHIIKHLATKIVMDDFLRNIYEETIQKIITETIHQELLIQHLTALDPHGEDRQQILLLPQFPAHHRLTQVMAGGIATGKSSVAKQFAAEFKSKYGLSLTDFARISTDTFRLLLLDDPYIGNDAITRGLLTQDEARLITDLSIRLIGKKVEQHGSAPHVFMEAVAPTDDELITGTKLGGKVRVAMTSYPPALAVKGNYERYQDKKERLPPVSAVLGSQSLTSKTAPRILDKHGGKDIVMTLHDTYEIIHKSAKGSALIAIFHCHHEKVIVCNLPGLLEFVKKSHVNTSATSPDTMYPDPDKISLPATVDHFLKDYGNKEIVFVDPGQEIHDINDYDNHAYAVYRPGSGLEIKNESVYRALIEHDEAARTAFELMLEKTTPGLERRKPAVTL
ncbi:hypothetical protein [Aquicella siphonis]|nr:hypothetical protein [Aquicella siphonis]